MPFLTGNPQLSVLQAEFNEVYGVRKIRRASRRRLLEVLHSTRALDSTLKAFINHHGCLQRAGRAPKISVGTFLRSGTTRLQD
jgi:hypothetical protein